MKKKTEKRERRDELRREYGLSKLKGGVRGKYTARYRTGIPPPLHSVALIAKLRRNEALNTTERLQQGVSSS